MRCQFIFFESVLQVTLLAFKLAQFIIDLVFEFLILGVGKKLLKLFSNDASVLVVRQFSHLGHVQSRIKIYFIFGICGEALAVIAISLRAKSQLLIYLANQEIYSSFSVSSCQQRIGGRQAPDHIIEITPNLVVVSFLEIVLLRILFIQFFLSKKLDGFFCSRKVRLLGEGSNQVNDRLMADGRILSLGVDEFEGLYGVLEITVIQSGKAHQQVVVIQPTAVRMPLDGNGSHLDHLFSVLLVGTSQRGVQLWKQTEYLVGIVIEALGDGLFHLKNLFLGVEISVEVSRCVVVDVARNGILIGRTAPGKSAGDDGYRSP